LIGNLLIDAARFDRLDRHKVCKLDQSLLGVYGTTFRWTLSG